MARMLKDGSSHACLVAFIGTHVSPGSPFASHGASYSAQNPTIIALIMAPVELVTLNDGNTIHWLGFGTGTALYNRDAAKSVTLAIENGVVHLDGAQMYGNEESLGQGIRASGKARSEVCGPIIPSNVSAQILLSALHHHQTAARLTHEPDRQRNAD